MEYLEIKDYLDRLIRIQDEAQSCEDLNANIKAIMITGPAIQMYKGIEIIADVMGLQLDSKKRGDGDMEYFFIYSGVEFFQIGKSDDIKKVSTNEREEKEV